LEFAKKFRDRFSDLEAGLNPGAGALGGWANLPPPLGHYFLFIG